jgi:hypothetical protein
MYVWDGTAWDVATNFNENTPFLSTGSTTARTLANRFADVVNVKDFGAVGDGVTDDTFACQTAVNFLVTQGGGQLYFPFGTYLLNGTIGLDGIKHGIHIPYTSPGIQGASKSIDIIGAGRDTILKAGSSGMYVIRYSGSLGCVRDIQILGDGTSLAGIALVGAHTTAGSGAADITHNDFTRLFIFYCVNGILLRAPSSSGVYYNNFSDIYIVYNQVPLAGQRGRGIYFQNGGAGNNNRNTFRSITIKRVNTGIEIQDGDTNTFYSCAFEDIGQGSTLPNNPGSSIIIGSGVISTENNRFFGCTDEAATQSVVNENSYSEFYGCTLGAAGTNIFIQQPMTWLGGYDGSQVPTIVPGLRRNANTPNFLNFDVTNINAETINISKALELSHIIQPISSSANINVDLGGTVSGTGPGGSNTTYPYLHPYSQGAIYLASGSAVSSTTGQMMIISFVIETASGTFIEQNLINYSSTTTGSFSFARSGNDKNFSFSVATNNGSTANVNRNLIRIS